MYDRMCDKIGVFTCICEDDSVWIPQYLAEIERLDLQFAIHLDRCTDVTKRRFREHRNCIALTQQRDPSIEFEERQKQGVFDSVAVAGCQWALAWDIDETWERDAPEKLEQLTEFDDCDHVQTRWLNLWEDDEHVRIDGPFLHNKRVKLYNLNRGVRWRFNHPITNGAAPDDGRELKLGFLDMACLHHGLKTRELRLQHKERWDRIYSTALRGDKNPYEFWEFACDETIGPVTIKHGYS